MMKIFALAATLFLSSFLYGQNDTLNLSFKEDSLRAIRVTKQVQDLLIPQFIEHNFENFFPVIDLWIDSCGYHEATLRTIIIEELLQKQNMELAAQDYFNEGYYETFRNRVIDSQEFNYHDFYLDNVVYYGYLPIKSSLDTLLKNRALLLKDSTFSSLDEKLIINLFTEDLDSFELEAIKKEYKNSFIGKYMLKEYRKERDQFPAFILGTGFHFPIGPFKTLGLSQNLTLGYSTPLYSDWVFDFIGNLRFTYRPKSYNFYAMDSVHNIKARTVFNFTASVGYKIVDFYIKNKTRIMILPKVGVGWDYLFTQIVEEISEEEVRGYAPLTLSTSIGFTTLVSVAKTSYIGLGFYYHFIPYNWDKSVKTKFDKNYMSVDLFWRI